MAITRNNFRVVTLGTGDLKLALQRSELSAACALLTGNNRHWRSGEWEALDGHLPLYSLQRAGGELVQVHDVYTGGEESEA